MPLKPSQTGTISVNSKSRRSERSAPDFRGAVCGYVPISVFRVFLPPPLIVVRSVLQARIERERSLAEDPILIARLGERKCLLCRGQNLLQRSDRVGEIRSPGDTFGAECVDHLAKERLRSALPPSLGRDVDRRDLEIDLAVL